MHRKVHLSRRILEIHVKAIKKSLDNPWIMFFVILSVPLLRILYKSWNDIQTTNDEFLNVI